MSALLTYAIGENGKSVHIDAVKNGGACKCLCPHCKKPVDAKNGGAIRDHHFAHSHGFTCEGAYESALHMLAKEVLLEEQCLRLPDSENPKYPQGLIHLRSVELEKVDNEHGIRPDVEGIMENGERLLIEILVSHKVQRRKHDTILENGLKCIEIDLNYVELDKEKIRHFLLEETDDRQWIKEYEEKSKGDGLGNTYERNAWHEKAAGFLKEKFDNNTIKLGFWHGEYDLKDKGYDVCEPLSRKFRGFKSDLLLYRSGKEDKGYISICIRGRKRNSEHKLPSNLRVIDIIIKNEDDFHWLVGINRLSDDGHRIIFEAFKQKIRPKQDHLDPILVDTRKLNELQKKGYIVPDFLVQH